MLPSKHLPNKLQAATPLVPGASSPSEGSATDALRTHREQATLAAVQRFLRALMVLLRSARLYPAQHPSYQECLANVERELRAAHEWAEPIELHVENGLLFLDAAHAGARYRLTDPARNPNAPRGRSLSRTPGAEEVLALAEELARRDIATLTILRCTHLGEISTLAALFQSAPPDSDWPALLAQYRIQGIFANAPRQSKQTESVVTELVASVLMPELPKVIAAAVAGASGAAHPGSDPTAGGDRSATSKPASTEECLAALRLLTQIASLIGSPDAIGGAEETAQALGRLLAAADRRVATQLGAAMANTPPQPNESLAPYAGRVAQALVLEVCAHCFRSARGNGKGAPAFGVREVRGFLEMAAQELNAPRAASGRAALDPRWGEEAYLEYLYELFWAALTPREKLQVLHGPQAWCAPAAALRHYLEEVAEPAEARSVLLQYARALGLPEAKARLAVTTGLMELCPLLDHLWDAGRRDPGFAAELVRGVTRAMLVERAPEVAAMLTALTDQLAVLALQKGDFGTYELILELLEEDRGDNAPEHLRRLRERLLAPERWQVMVDAALGDERNENLPRILGQQPERLLDDLGARLYATAEGQPVHRVPQMARVVQAIGEPAVGALVTRLRDPRNSRATTAAKLLLAWPTGTERLIDALPRALPDWDWNLQDMVVSELARPGARRAAGCEAALLEALPHAHPLVVPMMLDQIGLASSGETTEKAVPALLGIAAGRSERFKDVFVRIKAVEALGRLGARELPAGLRAETGVLLRNILRQRNGLTHVEPAGVRAAAEEALALIENHPASARVRTRYQAVAKASVSFQQPRRYLRIPLDFPLRGKLAAPAATQNGQKQNTAARSGCATVRVSSISLGGAFLETPERLNIGDSVQVQIQAGLRRIEGMAVVRNVTPAGGGVEFVHMNQDDREKLRRLVNRLMRG